MIRVTVDARPGDLLFSRLELAVSDGAFRAPLERAAYRVHRDLVQLTPKRTGITRRQWSVSSSVTDRGAVRVHNDSKVMLWLEKGTGWAGTATSHGGYIYPKNKKFLYIPLRHRAMAGWTPKLKLGGKRGDYILARRVRGIRAMNIIENYRPFALITLKAEMKAFLERHVK